MEQHWVDSILQDLERTLSDAEFSNTKEMLSQTRAILQAENKVAREKQNENARGNCPTVAGTVKPTGAYSGMQ